MEYEDIIDDRDTYAILDDTDYLGDIGKGEPIDFRDAKLGIRINGEQLFIPIEV